MKYNLATVKVPKIWTLCKAGFQEQENFKVLNDHFFTYVRRFENQLRTPFWMITFCLILQYSQNGQFSTKIPNPPLHGA